MIKSQINVVVKPLQIVVDYVRRRSLNRKMMVNCLHLNKNKGFNMAVLCGKS